MFQSAFFSFCCCTVHHLVLYCFVMFYFVLLCSVLNCTVLYFTALYCTILFSTVLYCLYYTILSSPVPSCLVLSCLVLTGVHLSILSCTSFSFSPFFYRRNDREDRLEVFLFFWLARLKILISSLQVIFFKFCFSIVLFHIFNQ